VESWAYHRRLDCSCSSAVVVGVADAVDAVVVGRKAAAGVEIVVGGHSFVDVAAAYTAKA